MPNTLIWIPKRLVELGLVNVAARSPEAFIDYCEQDYAARVEHAATCVRESGAHVVMLTGPSASGKTITAHKLADCIAAHGRRSAVDVKADGRIIGIPEKLAGDYVYYWADAGH